jgi:hypothetical protein
MFAIPHGEVLAEFETYPPAQELVNRLVTGGVPPTAVSIIGGDPTLVERITSRVGYGKVALQSAMSGSWLGLLAGLIFAVFVPEDFVTPLLAGLLIGAGTGMVIGMVVYSVNKSATRSYRSLHQVIAQSYRVVVSSNVHSQAIEAMNSTSREGES